MRRLWIYSTLALAIAMGTAAPARAQQSVSVYLGGFVPQKEDSRVAGDVFIGNLAFGGLVFDLGELNGFTIGGEWLFPVGEYLDGGLGVGVFSQTVPSVYAEYINDNGTEIRQDLKLRIVPFSATIRFLPLGRSAPIQPYIGAGVGIFSWRYSESGEFVDFYDYSIFNDRFVDSGAAVGPLILGGINVPMGRFGAGFEIRYQDGAGELDEDIGFYGTKVDLGGFNYLATFKIGF